MDSILKTVKEVYKLEIENHSTENLIYFTIKNPLNQPFKFGIKIAFHGIVGEESFTMNIPSLILKENEIDEFTKETTRISSIIYMLNREIKKQRES